MSAQLFLENSYLFTLETTLLDQQELPDSKFQLKFAQTIFHPQGGGQPDDSGIITQNDLQFNVEKLQSDPSDNNIWHIGTYSSHPFTPDAPVLMQIDEEKRRLNARIHSAGHLLDIGMEAIGYDLKGTKGYHFPKGSYVEYLGNIPNEERKQALERLTEACNKLINETQEPVQVIRYPYEEAKEKYDLPNIFSEGDLIRTIKLADVDRGCPCGGTHVQHLQDIGRVVATKMQKKGASLRVYYSVG